MIVGASAAFAPFGAAAQAVDAGSDGGRTSEASADDAEANDPAVASLRETARAARDLVADRLAAEVAPQTLFDLPLADESAIALEAARLGALLREIDATTRDAGRTRTAFGAGRDAGRVEAGATEVSPELWNARIGLDRARLAFYVLPAHRRGELLARHAERMMTEAGAPSEAEQRAKEAEEQRNEALRAARDARSEAERLVSEEYARLLDVERAQGAFEKTLAARRQELAEQRESTLGWQRRAREARGPGTRPDAVDSTYDGLRKALRAARDELDHALDEVSRDTSDVPRAGSDPLSELPTTIDTSAARDERRRVEATATKLLADEKSLRQEQASQLLDAIATLNGERLALLPFLSSAKRSAVTGFTGDGANQAASELRQLTLIARYHRYAAASWLASLRTSKQGLTLSVGGAALVLIEWLFAFGAFLWLRQRTPGVLENARKRAQDDDRRERLVSPSRATRAFTFALQVHRPIEWLGLAVLLSWLLPSAATGLLEVQLVTVIIEWVLGGALVVVVINALAEAEPGAANAADESPALRLRSLQLVGRVVVAFGLVLVLTSRLVGAGSIYQWVSSTFWVASLPVLLLLVRWWRDVVFRRVERTRKKSTFEKWVLANREGWKSFLAASAGGVYLFSSGAARATRNWVGHFNVTRRALAYLFRRELGKLEAERTELVTARIPDAEFGSLGPEAPSEHRVVTDIDETFDELVERLRDSRGGVIALVGARGMGKSVLLRRLHETFPDTLLMSAPHEGDGGLRASLGETLGLGPHATFDEEATALAASPTGRALLLDDAHHFVQPIMGGLATFDALLAAASKNCTKTAWVLVIDEVLWLFLQRARGSRPLFDHVIRLEPWREEQIIELLRTRTAQAGLTPTFERLLEKLPLNADEIDKQEALARRASSYYRLLWDYAAGNPGVALHMWRRALGSDAGGGTHVRFFQAPDTADLALLPDQAVFVLRAVLQLAPAAPREIGHATMLSHADVTDALRYALARGYVESRDDRYTITWTWLRAITLFLQRRHLLVTP